MIVGQLAEYSCTISIYIIIIITSYGRYRSVLTDTGTACNHLKMAWWIRSGFLLCTYLYKLIYICSTSLYRGKPDTPVGAQKRSAKLLPVRVRTSKLARNSSVPCKGSYQAAPDPRSRYQGKTN